VTYSIVARDAETGELGVAVQSQAFNTGAAVAWARAGVGAVATQSFTDRRYGWRGLELLAEGAAPADALARLRAGDELPELRQVGFLDTRGRTAQTTGAACIAAAGHVAGDGWAAQANLVESARVWEAMGEAFEAARGALALRLLAALDAAEAAGGDWRGRCAGGVVVVPASGEPWERVIDVRVEDSHTPLDDLRRLVERALAYRAWNRAGEGRVALARSAGLSAEHQAWSPILDALDEGDVDEARRLYATLLAREPRWEAYAGAVATHPEAGAPLRLLLGDERA
jgi:uncharacterized Ntn-hydrolase superfamily protein